jgi:hypothetical protein
VSQTFVAGCGRTASGDGANREYAYLDLAYPECPTCRFRIEPEDAEPFCVWRAEGDDPPLQAALKRVVSGG